MRRGGSKPKPMPKPKPASTKTWGAVCPGADPITLDEFSGMKLDEEDVVVIRPEIGPNSCAIRQGLVEALRAQPIYRYVMPPGKPESGFADKRFTFYKHPQTGVWLDAESLRALGSHTLFQLQHSGKEAIGTSFTQSSLHGELVDVYRLVPLSTKTSYLKHIRAGKIPEYRRDQYAVGARTRVAEEAKQRNAVGANAYAAQQHAALLQRYLADAETKRRYDQVAREEKEAADAIAEVDSESDDEDDEEDEEDDQPEIEPLEWPLPLNIRVGDVILAQQPESTNKRTIGRLSNWSPIYKTIDVGIGTRKQRWTWNAETQQWIPAIPSQKPALLFGAVNSSYMSSRAVLFAANSSRSY
jgi:hypothetical protein